MAYYLHYTSADGPEPDATWSVYREAYESAESVEPIDGSTVKVRTCTNEWLAHAWANHLQRDVNG